MSTALRGCLVEDLDEARAKAAGVLCGAAHHEDPVDAVVVLGALGRRDVVVTSDGDDLAVLAEAAGTALTTLRA